VPLKRNQKRQGNSMIKVTRLKSSQDSELVLNCELIETVEKTPDTVITLTNGKKLIVEESVEEIVRRVMDYRRGIFRTIR